MAEHTLTRSLTIHRPVAEVFTFFSDAGNLERITPKELNFHIITPQPIEMRQGTLIDYQLGLYGVTLKWRTEITVWDPPFEFVDTQLSGPYAKWVHRHGFKAVSPSETLIEDEVKYRLPLAPFGDIAHFFVRRQLDQIFDHRQKVVTDLLALKSGVPVATVNKVGAAGQ